METWANILLFVSSLIFLINVAPVDFFPGHRKLIKSIELLKSQRIIYGDLPSNVRVDFGKEPHIFDQKALSVLKNFIKRKSPKSKEIDWERVIGIGYSTMSLNSAEGLTMARTQSINLALIPTGNDTQIQVISVGSMSDLDIWISEPRQNSLNAFALLLLTVGFFMQMLPGLLPIFSGFIDFIKEKF
jgi:hypothetical protein